MGNTLFRNDVPGDIDWGSSVAIDTETTGLSAIRDRLCVIQMSCGDGNAILVQFEDSQFDCPNLKKMLADPSIEKIFHFARFDLMMIKKWLDIDCAPVFCTKIASKLVRTYTDRHGLRDLTREFLGIDLSKKQQSSDWANVELSRDQIDYAASDVLHLHKIKDRLVSMLQREQRENIAKACFAFLPTRVSLDIHGWEAHDIFAHSS